MDTKRTIQVELTVGNKDKYTNTMKIDDLGFPEKISDSELVNLLTTSFDQYLNIVAQDMRMRYQGK